jgi:hypothetical protein
MTKNRAFFAFFLFCCISVIPFSELIQDKRLKAEAKDNTFQWKYAEPESTGMSSVMLDKLQNYMDDG